MLTLFLLQHDLYHTLIGIAMESIQHMYTCLRQSKIRIPCILITETPCLGLPTMHFITSIFRCADTTHAHELLEEKKCIWMNTALWYRQYYAPSWLMTFFFKHKNDYYNTVERNKKCNLILWGRVPCLTNVWEDLNDFPLVTTAGLHTDAYGQRYPKRQI